MANNHLKNANAAAQSSFSGRTDFGGTTVRCQKISVKIHLEDGNVACPGRRHEIRAVGSPKGGSYSWSISGGNAHLLDIDGKPSNTDSHLWLLGFWPDDDKDFFPERKVRVSVTYTHDCGTAEATSHLIIHGIKFDVTDVKVIKQPTIFFIQGRDFVLGARDSLLPQMDTAPGPGVTIHLDRRCPRKEDCAKNHRVGWLQTITDFKEEVHYNNKRFHCPVRFPIIDVTSESFRQPPFVLRVHSFLNDGDTQFAIQTDHPGTKHPFTSQDPTVGNLTTFWFKMKFMDWLVVQNIEWEGRDLKRSFIFLRHFSWGIDYQGVVVYGLGPARLPVITEVRPPFSPTLPRRPIRAQKGKGPEDPVLTGQTFNDFMKQPGRCPAMR